MEFHPFPYLKDIIKQNTFLVMLRPGKYTWSVMDGLPFLLLKWD